MGLSYVLHRCSEGCSRGKSLSVDFVRSCASAGTRQRSRSHELLRIGRGDSERDSAVSSDSDLKLSKNQREPQREAHAALLLRLFPLTAPHLSRPLDGGKQQANRHGGEQRAARGLLTLPALLAGGQRKRQAGTAKNGIRQSKPYPTQSNPKTVQSILSSV